MAQRGKHFTFGSQGRPGPVSASPSSWRKGILLGLVLLVAALLLSDRAAPRQCALAGLDAVNYLSVNVGGFSVFVRWNQDGCR